MQAGLMRRECTNCDVYATEVIPQNPTAHVPGAWTVVTAATCTTEGQESRACTLCAEVIETRPIAVVDCVDTNGNGRCDFCDAELGTPPPAPRMIFNTRWRSSFWNWTMFFLLFGFIWMWF